MDYKSLVITEVDDRQNGDTLACTNSWVSAIRKLGYNNEQA